MLKFTLENCIACNKKDWFKLFTINNWDIIQCNICGYARLNEFPEINTRQDFYSKSSIDNRALIKKRGPAKKLAAVVRHYLRKISGRDKGTYFRGRLDFYLSKGDKVLDIGCGNGSVLSEIRTKYDCVGVEVSRHMAMHVEKELNIKTFCGNFQEVDFGDIKFDAVMMVSLLEHLPDPFESLKKCYELLNKDGVILLKTVNHQGVNRRLFGDQWTGYRPPDHMVYFGKNNLEKMMENIGYRNIIKSGGLFNDSFYCEAIK